MKKVTLYISESQKTSKKVKEFLDKNDVVYELKNVTKNKEYLAELQDMQIFGTPTTIIDGRKIQGGQIAKISFELGLSDMSEGDAFSFKDVFNE